MIESPNEIDKILNAAKGILLADSSWIDKAEREKIYDFQEEGWRLYDYTGQHRNMYFRWLRDNLLILIENLDIVESILKRGCLGMAEVTKLFRPVGVKELDLILNTGCRRYPERLPSQPIFYPVLNQEYAVEIAKLWNTKDNYSGFAGFVTEFNINEEFVSKYDSHIVGATRHKELWVPAEELSEFNSQIAIPIKISHAFYGESYLGKGEKIEGDYIKQFILLRNLKGYNPMDFSCTVQFNWKTVTMNYIAWMNYDFKEVKEAEKQVLLDEIKNILRRNYKWFFTF